MASYDGRMVGDLFGGNTMKVLKDIVLIDAVASKPYEYWCQDCKQLRLSFVLSNKCGNCGSKRIVKGDIGTLKKEV